MGEEEENIMGRSMIDFVRSLARRFRIWKAYKEINLFLQRCADKDGTSVEYQRDLFRGVLIKLSEKK